jgi:hypothetical protein
MPEVCGAEVGSGCCLASAGSAGFQPAMSKPQTANPEGAVLDSALQVR